MNIWQHHHLLPLKFVIVATVYRGQWLNDQVFLIIVSIAMDLVLVVVLLPKLMTNEF